MLTCEQQRTLAQLAACGLLDDMVHHIVRIGNASPGAKQQASWLARVFSRLW